MRIQGRDTIGGKLSWQNSVGQLVFRLSRKIKINGVDSRSKIDNELKTQGLN